MIKLKIFTCLLLISMSSIAQKSISIAFLTDEHKENTHFNALKNKIKAVLGTDFKVTFKTPLVNDFNLEKAQLNYQSLSENSAQLIIATGTTNAIFFYQEKNIKIPTIILGGVNKDLINIPTTQTTSKKNNVNFIVLPNSYSGDLNDFSSIYNFKKIGIIISDNKIKNLPIKKTLDTYFKDKTASYKLIPLVDNKIDISQLNDIDAVYFNDGYKFSEQETTQITTAINTKKLPSFSSNGIKDVKLGILASNKPTSIFNQLFTKIALHTEAILNGTNPSQLPIFVDYNNQLTINYSTAKKINLQLRYSILGRANLIGSFIDKPSKNAYSLKTLMKKVIQNNLELQAEHKKIALTEQDIKTSKSNYLPDLTANIQGIYIDPKIAQYATGQNPEIEAKADVTLKQLIYAPDANTGIKINKKLNKAQKENYNAEEMDALLNIASAYFNALILKTNTNIQNKNLQLTKQNLEIAKQNFEIGTSGKADVLRFRSQLAQNTQNVIDASNQLKQMYLTINQLLNTTISNDIELKDADISKGIFKDYNYESLKNMMDSPELLPKLVNFFVKTAHKNAPELKSLLLNREAIDLNYKLNKNGRYLPTIALQGQYNVGILKNGKGSTIPLGFPNLPNNTYNVALNVSIPIFGKNSRNIQQQSAFIQREQIDIQKLSLKQNLTRKVQEISLDLMGSISNIETSKISEKTAKESLDLTQNAYQNGSITIIQLIDSQNNYLQSKLGSATAKYQFLLTSIQLERIIGHFFLTHTQQENDLFFKNANQFIINKK
ncbi:TolC family protein [Tenacibaculum finnmarkense]|uniref:TolC family protein n=1 Tax=Tenacibaculum finnmarkense TaxID=2781243 RepID=UPI001E485FE2|nr:TolC family protein [Tenacibaculum finnmarkense]MCD8410627.1 TolC family protein [Tenacibaculum finnmarkense genomovar ulcerans]